MSCDHVRFLTDAARSLSWLAREVAPSFGPLGKDVAVVKDGHLLVTADGATVLNTLVEKRQENGGRDAGSRQENGYVTNNPVVAFALQRATTLVNKAGDGSISLTLFLAHAVQRFQSATRSAGKRGRVVEGRELRSLALQLTRVKQTVLPRRILPGLHNLAQEFTNEVLVAGLGMSPREILLQLLSSHLSGTFPPHVCASLALMTMEWIGLKSDDGASVQPDEKTLFLDKVYTCVRAVEAKLPHCVVQVPGATLLSSTVLRGHYLLRRPIFGKPSRERLLVRAPCSFCIVLGHTVLSAGDGDGEDGGLALPISLITAGKEDVALAAACRRGHQRRVLDHLARAGINVVLYEEALDRGAAHEIERAGIVAIDLVEREELLHLAELAGIVPVGRSDVADLGFGGEMAAAMKLKAIGKARRARPLTLAGEPFFIFEGVGRLGGTAHEEEHRSSPAPSPPTAPSQLLLRAASASLCSHYYRSMRRCLRLVARWAQPEIKVQNRGLVLPGAAVTELCVSTWLHQCTIRKEEEAASLAPALLALSAAAAAIPETLLCNATCVGALKSMKLGQNALPSRRSGMRIPELVRLGLSDEFQKLLDCNPVSAACAWVSEMDKIHRPLSHEPGVFTAHQGCGQQSWKRNWPVASLAAKRELISSAIYSSAALTSVDGALSISNNAGD